MKTDEDILQLFEITAFGINDVTKNHTRNPYLSKPVPLGAGTGKLG